MRGKMKKIKSIIASLIFIFVSFTSCTSVYVTKHPDYNYAPTNPNSVIIYDRLTPTYPFIIIGRIDIDATFTLSSKESNRKISEKAAAIGGDAVIITDVNVDIVAFNREVTTEGTITAKGDSLDYYAVSTDTSTYIPVTTLYGYVIKRQFSKRAKEESFKTKEEESFKNREVTVRVVKIKNWRDFTVLVGTSTILVLRPADASNIAWLKEGMDVVMVYFGDDNIRLFRHNGKSNKFRRIK